MQFSTIFLSLLAAATAVSAADITSYSHKGCAGSRITCAGIQEGRCCNFGIPMRSIRWTLPKNSRGFGYRSKSCPAKQATGPVHGPKTKHCLNYLKSTPRSAKWLVGSTGHARMAKRENKAEDCEKPNVYTYVDESGKEVSKEIPKDKADEVLEAYGKGELNADELKTIKVVDGSAEEYDSAVEESD